MADQLNGRQCPLMARTDVSRHCLLVYCVNGVTRTPQRSPAVLQPILSLQV